jgi:hypothetical protein
VIRSLSICGKVLRPGKTVEVPAGEWGAVEQAWEDRGLVRRLNPTSENKYLVRNNYRAEKPEPVKRKK